MFKSWIDKKDLVWFHWLLSSQYFPKPYEPFVGDINVEFDLSNYASEADSNQINKNTNLLQNILEQEQKRKRLFEKGPKKIAKMKNLSQNEFNQTAEMRSQSRDELDRIAKIRKN